MHDAALALVVCRDAADESEFQAAFERLMAAEIEDCLCVYKDDPERIARSPSMGDAHIGDCLRPG